MIKIPNHELCKNADVEKNDQNGRYNTNKLDLVTKLMTSI